MAGRECLNFWLTSRGQRWARVCRLTWALLETENTEEGNTLKNWTSCCSDWWGYKALIHWTVSVWEHFTCRIPQLGCCQIFVRIFTLIKTYIWSIQLSKDGHSNITCPSVMEPCHSPVRRWNLYPFLYLSYSIFVSTNRIQGKWYCISSTHSF